ncbi:hypothetical protein TEA_008068 [Camellia sinensis var. sinensis]|uniref:Squalene cyclase N-terminal domain-containing protein n=1 Tax=Camellia sinensis var. sinensis TaxID=542762 RepID=A0A4S4F151_CAMSN|nr:hypothetical protein TEA_008068 [Camellia sinensis var. sinensis]
MSNLSEFWFQIWKTPAFVLWKECKLVSLRQLNFARTSGAERRASKWNCMIVLYRAAMARGNLKQSCLRRKNVKSRMWKLKIAEGGSPWLRTLNDHVGRQFWEFDPKLGSPEELSEIEKVRDNFRNNRFQKKHSADLLMRIQFAKENPSRLLLPQVKVKDREDITEDQVMTTLRRAISFHSTLQAHDGHWPGDYGGPMFLMPGLVITLSIVGALNAVLSKEHKREICRYIYNHQARTNIDGGWGLHIEGPSTMFGTVLNYVTLRLLGEGANDGQGAVEKGHKWILDHGGATAITSWGKMWLSVLGVFEWSGNNPLPPEIWLLPYVLPVHPGRMWCHCRMVYLPMSYLYGKRFVGPITPTVLALRKELYAVPYHEIDWNQARNQCAKGEEFKVVLLLQIWVKKLRLRGTMETKMKGKPTEPLIALFASFGCGCGDTLHYFSTVLDPRGESQAPKSTKESGLSHVVTLGYSPSLQICPAKLDGTIPIEDLYYPHPLVQDVLWASLDKVVEPIFLHWPGKKLREKALRFVMEHIHYEDENTRYICIGPVNKVLDDCPGNLDFWYRHISKGAWPFSTADHGWPISDCTAEGLKAVLLLSKQSSDIVGKPLDVMRLYDAVNVILSLQNSDGGFATYELTRSYSWLECKIEEQILVAGIVSDGDDSEEKVRFCASEEESQQNRESEERETRI